MKNHRNNIASYRKKIVAQNWDNVLTAGSDVNSTSSGSAGGAPSAARERVAKALRYLGSGLGDVALRCCCYLEGLESAEKRMGLVCAFRQNRSEDRFAAFTAIL